MDLSPIDANRRLDAESLSVKWRGCFADNDFGQRKREWRKTMWSLKSKLQRVTLLTLPVLLFAGVSNAQYPILDKVANKVIQKYQNSSCEQLWQERRQPKNAERTGSRKFSA
jgi:hypothetical protein